MIAFIPFRAEHIDAIELQPAQVYLRPLLDRDETRVNAAQCRYALTCLVDGRIAGAGGVKAIDARCGLAWALISRALPISAWPVVTRKVNRVLDDCHRDGMTNIYTTIKRDFIAGHRWALALSFDPIEEQPLSYEDVLYDRYQRYRAKGAP